MHWNNYRYRKETDGIVIEEYEGEDLHVVIPPEIEGLPVKKNRTGGIQFTWSADRDHRSTGNGDGDRGWCL